MPSYEYERLPGQKGCARCRNEFSVVRRMSEPPLTACPTCGASIRRVYSAPGVGPSKSGFDDRARHAGFHKFNRLGKGEYEKSY